MADRDDVVDPPLWLRPPPTERGVVEAWDAIARLSSLDPADPPTGGEAYERGQALCASASPTDADLGRCWLWIAAAIGFPVAARELAAQITRFGPTAPGAPPAATLLHLVGTWLTRAEAASRPSRGKPAFAAAPALDAQAASGDERAPWTEASDGDGYGDDATPLLDETAQEPEGIVVVSAIGDPGSKEGRNIARKFAHVIHVPLPFRGRIPNPANFERDFLTRFPWATRLARYLRGQLALRRSVVAGVPSLPPLLLVGPPGCGKTTMLEWIARYCEFASMTMPVGGTNDSGGLAAVARGWDTATPSAPVQMMADHGCANPCIILDELDKGVHDTTNRNGSVAGILLAMLQPPADGFRDAYLMAPVDISHVNFMASANSLRPLSEALRGRFLIQPVPAPGPEHFETILVGVIEAEAARLGVPPEMLPWVTPGDSAWLRSAFLSGRGDIRPLVSAYRLLVGDKAADEELAMRAPH